MWLVDWCRLGGERFTDPFFHDTLRRVERRPFNRVFRPQTPFDDLAESDPRAIAPAGFVFHLSRCGSTLVAQTFAARSDTIVLSEAGPIDDVLRARRFAPDVTDDWRVSRLRAIVAALGRRRSPHERHLVLKMDAWHALDLAIVERAFPGVPWFFVYRDPVAILVSHARTPSWFMSLVNVPGILEIDLPAALALTSEDRSARVLARIATAVLDRGVICDRLVSYDAGLYTAIEDRIGPAFGLVLRPAERAVLPRNAKAPSEPFSADSEEKMRAATTEIRAAAARFVAAPYARLETIRTRAQDRTMRDAVPEASWERS